MDVITLLTAALAFVAVAGVGFAITAPNTAQTTKRVRAMNETRRPSRALAVTDAAGAKRRQANLDAVKDMAERERQSRKTRLSVQGRLQQASLNISMPMFWMASAAAGVTLALMLLVMKAPPVVIVAGLIAGGLGLPRWFLGYLVKKRQVKFVDQFADGIDVIVRGVKSGLPLAQCMQIVAQESSEPLRSEFKALIDGISMGVPLGQNMQRFYDRMPLPEVNFFGIVLVIQQKTGGNLAEALGNLSTVLRSRKLLKEKIKALSAEAKASAMIIGALPFLVGGLVYVTRPDYMAPLFNTDTGKLILMGCALMMGAGIFTMKRMVDFKY